MRAQLIPVHTCVRARKDVHAGEMLDNNDVQPQIQAKMMYNSSSSLRFTAYKALFLLIATIERVINLLLS